MYEWFSVGEVVDEIMSIFCLPWKTLLKNGFQLLIQVIFAFIAMAKKPY